MKLRHLPFLSLLVCACLGPLHAQAGTPAPAGDASSLTEARKGFRTNVIHTKREGLPIPVPPADVFNLVRYDAQAGKLGAYLSPNPHDGKKHPAIIWITGGDSNSIDDLWHEGPESNDQTASAYRKAGVIMMFPSLRGGNDNPGVKEGFLGEVDDILAAATYLARQEYVDPARIYLGGHSTGGTLVLLAAASSKRFRAVFSFGPVDEIEGYGAQFNPFDTTNPRELALRSPGRWLSSIQVPVFVFEGAKGGNMSSLRAMEKKSTNPNIRFFPVAGATHFSVMAPTNRLIAEEILRDTGPTSNIWFSMNQVERPFRAR